MNKALVFIVLAALAATGLGMALRWLSDNKLPNVRQETELYVRPETGADEVLAFLGDKVRRPRSLKRTFAKKKVAEFMVPGHYTLSPRSTSVYIARMLDNGWQTPVRLTLSGSLRRKGDIARKIGAQMMADSAAVAAALSDTVLLKEFGAKPDNVFALFLPDTYEVWWDASVEDILLRQKKELDAFWTPARLAKAKALGLSRQQVTALASIVNGESNWRPEYPKIAGVYLNRLDKKMKLQADPTVAYCYDYEPTRILKEHLKKDSKYNTYMYAGLPPGPICVPDKAALDAVLNPDRAGGALYFCADPSFNGSHRFAKTYQEHLRNARAFQKALNERLASK